MQVFKSVWMAKAEYLIGEISCSTANHKRESATYEELKVK